MTTLNVTNGDSVIQIMQQAGIGGDLLPWRDVLHEGPVPAGLSLQEMSEVRVKFIANQNWAKLDEVREWFHYRDNLLSNFRNYERVVLWFEHDLYDQLQIIQILTWFASQDLENTNIHLICTDNYLGMLSPAEMSELENHAQPLLYEQVVIATTAWQTYTLDTPLEWQNLLQQDTSCLPFLADAVKRILQEYPDAKTGLTLTQKQALLALQQKAMPAGQLFTAYQQSEERRFMGDTQFWGYLAQMLEGDLPLIKLPEGQTLTLPASPDQILSITEVGQQVINGELQWPGLGNINRWIGGVHLKADNIWVWDEVEEKIGRQK
ncbi:MAG: hypothetical protein OEM38_09230 [Gammaproteobacteria bacterium]|nr:hypothetical protein [Gammaproteobacteria bacterium]